MLLDYHMHLENGPYTLSWLERFLQAAEKRGIVEIGVSEHAYRFRQAGELFSHPWEMARQTEDLEEYVNLILTAKERGWPVKLGIEVDFVPGKEEETRKFLAPYPWDFVLGSVHWLGEWGFDNPDFAAEWEHRDLVQVWTEYFSLLQQAAKSQLFDTLAHPDVIKVFGYRPAVALAPLWEKTVPVIKESGVAIEVSTAGLRKPVGELYPDEGFLVRLNQAGIPATLASDAHHPEDVGRDFSQGVALLRRCGYETISAFTGRRRSQVPLGG